MQVHGDAEIEYVPFPADLNGRYQHFTEADLSSLRELGYDFEFTQLEHGEEEAFKALGE